MCNTCSAKSQILPLVSNTYVNSETFILSFNWQGPAPKAGQFFMIRPEPSAVYLPRPISIFEYNPATQVVKFLIANVGRGTNELAGLVLGNKVRLTGPLGNAWKDFLPEKGKAALIGGSVGVAPLAALAAENPDYDFHLYAGFKNGFNDKDEENLFLGAAANVKKLVLTAEDGKNALHGMVTDYLFEPKNYDVIFSCGSKAMLAGVKKKCAPHDVPCYLSMESKLACGVGACLGCVIKTVHGNRRCCADGPIFPAGDVIFDE